MEAKVRNGLNTIISATDKVYFNDLDTYTVRSMEIENIFDLKKISVPEF